MTTNLFDDAFEKAQFHSKEQTDRTAQDRWEHKIVGNILAKFNLQSSGKQIMQIGAKREPKLHSLRFYAFKQLYPSFPVWLVCRKIPYVYRDLTPERMVKSWTKLKVFEAFEQAETEAPPEYQTGSSFGIVFEWLGVFPVAIMSNAYYESEFSETVFKRTLRNVQPYQHMAIQSFDNFLGSLRWKAE